MEAIRGEGEHVGLLTADAFTVPAVPNLKPGDRPDCCGSYTPSIRVQMPSGKLLDFCGHHYRKHELALLAHGANVVQIIHREGN
jgi:hypothetical protein